MALKNLNFDVGVNGIMPNVVTDAGIQGDHGVTRLNFALTEEFYNDIIGAISDGKVMYRFDIYDGEGGIWQSESKELFSRDVDITLQERHTRFGGKLVLYLVMTLLSSQNEMEIELYNSPIVLRLKNRPNGKHKQGEDYESIVSIVEIAKQQAMLASNFAETTKNHHDEAKEFIEEFEEKLNGINLDGVGIVAISIINDELVISYTDGTKQNLGNIKGPKGDNGTDGNDLEIDNNYSSTSLNAQSGKAVAQALTLKQDVLVSGQNIKTINGNDILGEGDIVIAPSSSESVDLNNYYTKDEISKLEYVNKKYVDDVAAKKQNVLVSGENIKTINGSSILGAGDIVITSVSDNELDLSNYYTKYEINDMPIMRNVDCSSGGFDFVTESTKTSLQLNNDGGINLYTAPNYHINVHNSKITDLGSPTNATDAATKQYVDDALNTKLDSDAITDYATKQYVDDAVGNIVPDGSGGSVNLSNYYTKDVIDTALSTKLDGEIVELDVSAFSGNTVEDVPESCVRTLTSISVSTLGQTEIVFVRFDGITLSTNRISKQELIDKGYIAGARYLLEFADEKVTRIARVSVPYVDALVGDIESLLGGI